MSIFIPILDDPFFSRMGQTCRYYYQKERENSDETRTIFWFFVLRTTGPLPQHFHSRLPPFWEEGSSLNVSIQAKIGYLLHLSTGSKDENRCHICVARSFFYCSPHLFVYGREAQAASRCPGSSAPLQQGSRLRGAWPIPPTATGFLGRISLLGPSKHLPYFQIWPRKGKWH